MKREITVYACDKCGKKISDRNTLDIMTSLSEDKFWSRLHVQILHIHGINNDSKTDNAELCQDCTMKLLDDAFRRVQKGERATAGTEDSQEKGW